MGLNPSAKLSIGNQFHITAHILSPEIVFHLNRICQHHTAIAMPVFCEEPSRYAFKVNKTCAECLCDRMHCQ